MNISTQVARRKTPRQADAMRALVQNSCLALAALALTGCSELASAQVLPTDAKPLCSFETGEFPGWFATGAVTLNGAVKPKDSLNFAPEILPDDRRLPLPQMGGADVSLAGLSTPVATGFSNRRIFTVFQPRGDDGMRNLMPNTPRKNNLFVRGSKPVEAGGQPDETSRLDGRKQVACVLLNPRQRSLCLLCNRNKDWRDNAAPTRVPIEKPELEQISAFAQSRGINFRQSESPWSSR